MTSKLRVGQIGDIHLGHPNTTTEWIIANLLRAFPNNAETGQLDIIFIVGDVFDRLLSFPQPEALLIRLWINRFLRMCKQRDILVRVLEGTPSHDWKQSKHFVVENDSAEIGCDLKYVDTLSIEYIERFGINVLYIPDEWKHETDEIWIDAQLCLREHGLEQVDFVAMHGAFRYQLPSHVQVPTHDPDRYLSICKYFVMVGHIHQHSVYQRIVAAGSTDRLCHGDEGTKGHVRLLVDREHGQHEISFVENPNSKLYVSLDCTGLTLDEAFEKLKVIDTYPHGSHVRVLAGKGDPVITTSDVLKQKFIHVTLTTKATDVVKSEKGVVAQIITPYTPPAITRENIVTLVSDKLSTMGVPADVQKRAEALLNGQIS